MKIGAILSKDFGITQNFGENPQIYRQFNLAGHNGIDFATPEGTEIFSPISGEVLSAGYDANGYGKFLKIRNSSLEVIFGHLSYFEVKEGDKISKGDFLGKTGNTGFSTGPHLHFGLREIEKNEVLDYGNGYFGYKDPKNFFEEKYFDSKLVVKKKIEKEINLPLNYDNVSPFAREAYEFVIKGELSNGERPKSFISREEIFLILLRFAEYLGEYIKINEKYENLDFSSLDIQDRPSEWAEFAYMFVVGEGISNGERPKSFITRQEVWVMLKNFFDDYDMFKDSDKKTFAGVSPWALEGARFVYANDISDCKNPTDLITRQEFWVMIHRCADIAEE